MILLLCLLTAAVFAVWLAAGRREGGILRLTCDGEVIAQSSLRELARSETKDGASEKISYCLFLYKEEGVSCVWYQERPDLVSAVPEGSGYNLVSVSDGVVRMEAADCPDQICVHHISIRNGGESIICLPHKLVVEILGETEEEALDGMARAERAGKKFRDEGRHSHEKDG